MRLIKDEFKSRKWLTVLITIATISTGMFLAKISDAVGCGSIVTLVISYLGANTLESRK